MTVNSKDKFNLNSTLKKDSDFICDLKLCELRLIRDGELDWFILIPKINDLVEVHDLSRDNQIQLMDEINQVSKVLKKNVSPKKINIAAIGNMVSQLHIHIIARFETDRAWPGVIWGTKAVKTCLSHRASFWRELF